MEVDFSGNFLNGKTCEDGEIAEILGEGEMKEMEFKNQKKNVLNIPVKYKDKDMIFTPSNTAGRTLQEAWGKDTKSWIGKKFQTFSVDDKMIVKPIA